MRGYYMRHRDSVLARVKRYREKNLAAIQKYDRQRGFRGDPQKTWARNKARTVKAQPCEVCGATPADKHHDDYSQPTSVRFLCEYHHGIEHRKAA